MEKKRIIKIGVIISLAIFIFIWGMNYLKNKNIFKPENTYYGIYKDINGLSKSSPVMLSGFKIGQVADIYFVSDTSENLIVEMLIDSKFNIPDSSNAQIFSIDLMGTKGIQILRNDSVKTYISTGDTLLTSTESGLKDQVSMQILPLKAKAEDLIASFDSVLVSVRTIFDDKTRRNLSKSFASIRITLKNLENTTFTLDTLMSNEKTVLAAILNNAESITGNLKNNNEHLSNIIQNFSAISDSVAKADIASVITNADRTIDGLDKIVSKIESGEGSLGMLINNDTLYNNLEDASYNLSRLLRDLKENPKRYVRFSAFDLGKTVIVKDSKESKKKKSKDK